MNSKSGIFISSYRHHPIAGAWACAQCSGFTWAEQIESGKEEGNELELHSGRLYLLGLSKEDIRDRLVGIRLSKSVG